MLAPGVEVGGFPAEREPSERGVGGERSRAQVLNLR